MTQQKLKWHRHRATRYLRQHYTGLPQYCAASSTLPSLILTSTRRVNCSNALCLHDIVKLCLPQYHACCDNSCYILLPVSCFSGGRRSSIWQLCRRWWHRGLSLWQLAVPPVTAGLSSWRPFAFSVSATINAHSLYFVFYTMASSSISYASLLCHPYRHCFECVS